MKFVITAIDSKDYNSIHNILEEYLHLQTAINRIVNQQEALAGNSLDVLVSKRELLCETIIQFCNSDLISRSTFNIVVTDTEYPPVFADALIAFWQITLAPSNPLRVLLGSPFLFYSPASMLRDIIAMIEEQAKSNLDNQIFNLIDIEERVDKVFYTHFVSLHLLLIYMVLRTDGALISFLT